MCRGAFHGFPELLILAGSVLGIAIAVTAVWCLASTARLFYPEKHPCKRVALNGAVHSVLLDEPSALRVWHFPSGPRLGVVVLLHGYFADRNQVFGLAEALRRRGFEALVIELPGHGMRPGPFLFGKRLRADGAKLRRWIEKDPVLRGLPKAVLGWSTGGQIALQWLHDQPGFFGAVVADSLFSRLGPVIGRYVKERYRLPQWLGALTFWSAAFLSGQRLWRRDPVALAAKLSVPLLAIHGNDDGRVRLDDAEAWYAKWRGAKEHWLVPGCRHIGAFAAAPDAYVERISAFFLRSWRA